MLLCRFLERSGTRSSAAVIALRGDGALTKRLHEAGVPATNLHLRSPQLAAAVRSIRAELRRNPPDVVQTWMYHADLLGGLAAGAAPVVWGLHAAPSLESERIPLRTRAGLYAAAWMSSRRPSRIVCCSHATARVHAELGYDSGRFVVIPNGFERVKRMTNARAEVLGEFGLDSAALLVGRVGRNHPQKDTPTLVAAFAAVRREVQAARLVLVGDGFTRANSSLLADIRGVGLSPDDVLLVGQRDDVVRLNSAFDVVVSSSYSEGLPVVLGEAMAVGTPVVATEVGDSALLVHDKSRLVSPRDPAALAKALITVLTASESDRRELGARDQERVRSEFAFDDMVRSYEELYREIAALGT